MTSVAAASAAAASSTTTQNSSTHPTLVLRLRPAERLSKLITMLNGHVPQSVLITLRKAMQEGDQRTVLLTLGYIRELLRPLIVREGKGSPLFEIGLGIMLCLADYLPADLTKETFLQWYTAHRIHQQLQIAEMEMEEEEQQAFYEGLDKSSLQAVTSMEAAVGTTEKTQLAYVRQRNAESQRVEADQERLHQSITEFQRRLSRIKMLPLSLPDWLKMGPG